VGEGANLLSSLSLGKKTLKNRIVFGPIRTNRAEKNLLGRWHQAYYEERARGGAGMIIAEGASVLPFHYPYERAINICRQGALESYQKTADIVHKYECLLIGQLNHYGCQAGSGISDREMWAPSAFPEVDSGEVPKIMEEEDIEGVIAGFLSGAEKLSAAGLDGVEINAGQFSLLRQFLSPLTNFRSDHYGGSLENRARFLVHLLKKVREKLGEDFILGLRLCGDEYAPWAGLTPEQSGEVARYISDQVELDYITVEVGSVFSINMTMASMRVPVDYANGPAELIKKAVNIPVCATGSIANVELAEGMVESGIDLVEMTRPLNADPRLPVKYKDGLKEKIRPCLLCNQGCYTHMMTNPPLSCAMNPLAGREEKYPERKRPVPWRKTVFVVGGGPAGLEAAAVVARRGHQVVLFEKSSMLGGRLNLAAKIPGNGGFLLGIDYLIKNAREQGVKLRMNREFTIKTLEEETPDVIVLAEGSKPAPVSITIDSKARVFRPEEVLGGIGRLAGHVAVIDLEGSWSGIGIAVAFAQQAQSVQIISPDFFIASQLAAKGEFKSLYQAALSMGIKFIPQTEVTAVGENYLETIDKFSREKSIIKDIDCVLLAMPNYPQNDLYQALLGRGIEVWTAGDCVAPRDFGTAVREGFQAGIKI